MKWTPCAAGCFPSLAVNARLHASLTHLPSEILSRMSQRPLIHIVIPTRERAATLASTLQTCLEQQDPDLRVLVSDNCSEDATPQLLASITDPRFSYVRTPRRLSMSENFEHALEHVTDGYVYSIGDDDAVLPGFAPQLRKIIEATSAKIIWPIMPTYCWENHPSDVDRGILRNLPLTATWRWSSCAEALEDSSKHLESSNYFYERLPSVYHGCIHTEVLQEARKQFGKIFLTNQPDLFSAVAIAAVTEKFLLFSGPLSLNAMSGRSNGASLSMTSGLNSESQNFYKESAISYSPEILGNITPGDFGNAIPAVMADQFLVAARFSDRIPKLDWAHVIEAVARWSANAASEERYEQISNVAREIGRLHDRKTLAEEVLKRFPFRAKKRLRAGTVYRAPDQTFETIDLTSEGVVDARGAAKFAGDLLAHYRTPSKGVTQQSSGSSFSLSWTPSVEVFLRRHGFQLCGRLLVVGSSPEYIIAQTKLPPTRVSMADGWDTGGSKNASHLPNHVQGPYACALIVDDGEGFANRMEKISNVIQEGGLVWVLIPSAAQTSSSDLRIAGFEHLKTLPVSATKWEARATACADLCLHLKGSATLHAAGLWVTRVASRRLLAHSDTSANRTLNWNYQLWKKLGA